MSAQASLLRAFALQGDIIKTASRSAIYSGGIQFDAYGRKHVDSEQLELLRLAEAVLHEFVAGWGVRA